MQGIGSERMVRLRVCGYSKKGSIGQGLEWEWLSGLVVLSKLFLEFIRIWLLSAKGEYGVC